MDSPLSIHIGNLLDIPRRYVERILRVGGEGLGKCRLGRLCRSALGSSPDSGIGTSPHPRGSQG